MKKRSDENQKRYNAVVKFFDTEFPEGGKLPEILDASVADLKTSVDIFHDKAVNQKAISIGNTSDKNKGRQIVCKEGAMLSRLLRALAKKTSNDGLYQNARFTKSSLSRLKDSTLVYQCSEIVKSATPYIADLLKVGITDAHMQQIEVNLQSFRDQIVTSRLAVVEKSFLGNTMVAVHGDASMILRNQIFPIMDILKEKYPQWVNSFYQAAKIIVQPSSKAQIKGEITAAGSFKTLVGANVSINGTTLSRISRKAGAFSFRRLEPGNYNLTVTRKGYQPVELPGVVVEASQTTKLSIQLRKEELVVN